MEPRLAGSNSEASCNRTRANTQSNQSPRSQLPCFKPSSNLLSRLLRACSSSNLQQYLHDEIGIKAAIAGRFHNC